MPSCNKYGLWNMTVWLKQNFLGRARCWVGIIGLQLSSCGLVRRSGTSSVKNFVFSHLIRFNYNAEPNLRCKPNRHNLNDWKPCRFDSSTVKFKAELNLNHHRRNHRKTCWLNSSTVKFKAELTHTLTLASQMQLSENLLAQLKYC